MEDTCSPGSWKLAVWSYGRPAEILQWSPEYISGASYLRKVASTSHLNSFNQYTYTLDQ